MLSRTRHQNMPSTRFRIKRQSGSCDQCRKAKRACDVPDLDVNKITSSIWDPYPHQEPCSYCAKTNKSCTMEWARSQAQSSRKHHHKQSSHRMRRNTEPTPQLTRRPIITAATETGSKIGSIPHGGNSAPTLWEESSDGDLSGPGADQDLMLPVDFLTNLDSDWLANEGQTFLASYTETPAQPDLVLQGTSNDANIFAQGLLDHELDVTSSFHQAQPYSRSASSSRGHSDSVSSSLTNEAEQPLTDSDLSLYNPDTVSWNGRSGFLSEFTIDHQMMMASNNRMASENLTRIYHDVLEHNLSCWITEMTCPYQPQLMSSTDTVPEWGSSWCNRIYQRTIRLDRAAQSCYLVELTWDESQKASKALNLAIMAFATQWAQDSPRHHERFSTASPSSSEFECGLDMTDEFDRILQKNLWEQTRRALDEAADVECFRMACAESIFGLTQKPWDSQRGSQDDTSVLDHLPFSIESVMGRLRHIIRKEGPPVYMERAARKMHALKFRYDSMEIGGPGHRTRRSRKQLNPEDRVTIGLLYWLAIMFDTVSSSMNERPVVVMDQDCEIKSLRICQQHVNTNKMYEERRWDLDLFTNREDDEAHPTHWPCSYEEAAKNVIKSAPVKVLLFRHLHYLQNTIRKGAPKKKIEEVIRSTTELYDYWNRTHGAFFRELVEDYSAVPQRIQGWFVCISAHWHLAALMVADLLEIVGDEEDQIIAEMYLQGYGQTAKRIRKHSTKELSDLARVGAPSLACSSSGVPQMTDFHHAVNEGTLLTEPWTMILIRAFAKACMTCMVELDDSLRNDVGQHSYDQDENMKQAEYCIKGLWLLGKKSDMARAIANMLLLAFKKLQGESTSVG